MKALTHTNSDNIKYAVAAILFTVLALSLGDAFIKQISTDFTLWQIFIFRSLIAIPMLILVSKNRGITSFKPHQLFWTASRSLMLTFMWVAYYMALPRIDLSIAAAAYYTLPIFITLFAALFIGDKIGGRGWTVVFLGFAGVILILKPQAAQFNAYALLPILSAVLYALAMILTRTKCRDENPLLLSLALNISFIAVGILATLFIKLGQPLLVAAANDSFLLGQGTVMGLSEWAVMGLLAMMTLIGSIGAAYAYQAAPSAIVATFDFAYVAFATVWGLLFFGEVPDLITMIGMGFIVGSGLIAVRQ